MGAILKNIHWLIIAYALYSLGNHYYENIEVQANRDQEIENARIELTKLEKTKKDIKKYLENIENEKTNIERVAQEIEKTQQVLPGELSDTENIALLRKMAEDVNIKEISISPEKDDDRGFYFARRYRFKAKATYLQFLIMFEKIAEGKRILNIGEVNFKKLEQPQRSKFQLINGEFTLEAYRYNSNYKEDRGIEKIQEKIKSESASEAKNLPPRQGKNSGEAE